MFFFDTFKIFIRAFITRTHKMDMLYEFLLRNLFDCLFYFIFIEINYSLINEVFFMMGFVLKRYAAMQLFVFLSVRLLRTYSYPLIMKLLFKLSEFNCSFNILPVAK
jgi:hypothetical protein